MMLMISLGITSSCTFVLYWRLCFMSAVCFNLCKYVKQYNGYYICLGNDPTRNLSKL